MSLNFVAHSMGFDNPTPATLLNRDSMTKTGWKFFLKI